MQRSDEHGFAQLLAALATVFDKELGEELVGVYFKALEDMPLEDLATATKRAIRECKFFPRPAELRELAGTGLSSAEVYARVVAVLRRSPLRLPRDLEPFDALVIASLGGPAVLTMDAGLLRKLVDDRTAEWVNLARAQGIALRPESGRVRLPGPERPAAPPLARDPQAVEGARTLLAQVAAQAGRVRRGMSDAQIEERKEALREQAKILGKDL